MNEKAVLISVNPKWCNLIASGVKTVEIRKNKPKLATPFKVYIYCTANKQGVHDLLEIHGTNGKIYKANCKVIGEFICDSIEWIGQSSLVVKEDTDKALAGSCLTREEIFKYLGLPRPQGDNRYRECYGWHISNLIIYDKPKELTEFQSITRPPQSWCYVNKL